MKTVLTAVEMKLELGLEKSAAHSVYFFKAARKENQAARLTMGTQVRGKGQKQP
ncbi:MAG: hypothetical protein MJZ54_07405 [Bacteroidaceae bacterium]|nr:hypothetical protein [Bacteroidaceae bacterium]